jgi:hypothetical protein
MLEQAAQDLPPARISEQRESAARIAGAA